MLNNIIMEDDRMVEWVADTLLRSKELDHEWDRLAIDWPALNNDSVVFEVGAYRGRWAYQIAKKYNPRLFCFEPQQWAADTCTHLLESFNAQVFNFGLGTKNGRLPMGEWGTDGCSFNRSTRTKDMGVMRDINQIVEELETPVIDLMLVNIEGYEFTLIPYMFSCSIFPKVIMIQGHGDSGKTADLWETVTMHYGDPLWSYGYTLTAWGAKE